MTGLRRNHPYSQVIYDYEDKQHSLHLSLKHLVLAIVRDNNEGLTGLLVWFRFAIAIFVPNLETRALSD